MRQLFTKYGMVVVLLMLMLVGIASAAWKSNWKYSASDLAGTDCIQEAIDDLADRTGASSTAAAKTAVLSTNAAAFLYLQSGSFTATGATATQTFATVFSAAPTVVWRYTTEGIPATNATTVASNSIIIADCQTNVEWIAVGLKP